MTVRPATIRAVSILLTIVAAVYFLGLVVNLVLLFNPREEQLLIDRPISDWFWVLSGLLCLALTIAMLWLSRLVWRGDHAVGVTVSVLCVITAAFSLFGLAAGFGWGALAISITILVLNSSKPSQRWYDSVAMQ
jgi:hypothetical protein